MKKLNKDIIGFTRSGMLVGVGSMTVTKMGGSTAGFATVGRMMPIVGTTMMGGHTINLLKRYKYKK